jgi:hypothetical protein
MHGLWMQDIESFEQISQDASARRLFLKMAEMSKAGRIGFFLAELAADDEVDEDTKGSLTELAHDHAFLLAVQDYLERTHRFH